MTKAKLVHQMRMDLKVYFRKRGAVLSDLERVGEGRRERCENRECDKSRRIKRAEMIE